MYVSTTQCIAEWLHWLNRRFDMVIRYEYILLTFALLTFAYQHETLKCCEKMCLSVYLMYWRDGYSCLIGVVLIFKIQDHCWSTRVVDQATTSMTMATQWLRTGQYRSAHGSLAPRSSGWNWVCQHNQYGETGVINNPVTPLSGWNELCQLRLLSLWLLHSTPRSTRQVGVT